MNQKMKDALLQMYRNLNEAETRQAERGVHDQGERSKVTGGKHMNPIAEAIRQDLISCGFADKDVYYKGGCLRLPGWFRPSKDWDLLAFGDDELLAAVELKSINSSFGNNANNRSEESLGSAIDLDHAVKNSLIPFNTQPPVIGYVLVVKMCNESLKKSGEPHKSVYPIDKVFLHASYFDRLRILCKRLLSERLYQAVWIVGVDPKSGEIVEPDKDLTYDKFIAAIQSRLTVHMA